MKFLSDNIEITIKDLNIPKDGMYRYNVVIDQEIVFVGNTFINAGVQNKTFYLNDILKNYQFKGVIQEDYNDNVYCEVEVYLYVGDKEHTNSTNVMFLYQYPNFNSKVNTPLPIEEEGYWVPMLQGYDFYELTNPLLKPTYPFVYSDKLHYNFLGFYNNIEDAGLGQFLKLYCIETGQCNTEGYSINIMNNNKRGVYGTSQYSLYDVLGNIQNGEEKQVYAITNFNLVYRSSSNTWSSVYNNVMHRWEHKTNELLGSKNIPYSASATLSHTTDKYRTYSKQVFFEDNKAKLNIDTYSNTGYNKLVVDVYNSSDEKICSVAYDPTKLYNRENNYVVPLHFTFEYNTSDYRLYTYTEPTTINLSYIRPDEIIIETDGEQVPIATLDYCSRYFLRWMDRYGMPQIQPFNTTTTYSENLDYTEIINYKNERKKSGISVQPKWKLNTGWLSSEIYPCYESIYVSPYLQLYDAKEDMLYDVILTNKDYTEKTYKNQGNQMFNLQLDVELDKKQNMIY